MHSRTSVSIPYDLKASLNQSFLYVVHIYVLNACGRGLRALGAAVGRIGLLECYKLLQLKQTATPTAAAVAAAAKRERERRATKCVRQKRRHFESSAHAAALCSRSLLRVEQRMLSRDSALAQGRS